MGSTGIQGSGVFIQKQQFGGYQGGHQQSQCLALAAGKQAYAVIHTVFQPQLQLCQTLPEVCPVGLADPGEGGGMTGCPHVGQSQIFFDGHIGGCALQGILEQPADEFASFEIRQGGNILAIQDHPTGVRLESAGNGTEESGLACTVGAQNGDEIAFVQMQIHPSQGGFFIDCALGKGFGNIF